MKTVKAKARKATQTPIARRTARVKEFKRDLIIEAARTVFDAHGLEAASLRTIAAEAGCTTGAIYGHFSGKEEIYAELLRRSLQALEVDVRQADGGPKGFAARFMAFARFYAARPSDFSLSLYLYDRKAPLGLGTELNRELNTQFRAVMTYVVYGAASGKSRSEEEEALVYAMLAGLLMLNRAGRLKLFGSDIEAMAELAVARLKLAR